SITAAECSLSVRRLDVTCEIGLKSRPHLLDRTKEMRWLRGLQDCGQGVAPCDRARIHAGRSGGLDVAEFVANTDGLGGPGSKQPRNVPKLVMLAEQRGAAIETGDECRARPKDLPDRCVAVRTHDRGLDAETLHVGQQRRYAVEQRYPGCGCELAPPHVADDGGQSP